MHSDGLASTLMNAWLMRTCAFALLLVCAGVGRRAAADGAAYTHRVSMLGWCNRLQAGAAAEDLMLALAGAGGPVQG